LYEGAPLIDTLQTFEGEIAPNCPRGSATDVSVSNSYLDFIKQSRFLREMAPPFR